MKCPRPPQRAAIRRRDRCANPRLQSAARRSCPPAPRLRIEDVAQAVAEQIETEHRQEDGKARKHREPRRRRDLVAGVRQHAAPARKRRGGAQGRETKKSALKKPAPTTP